MAITRRGTKDDDSVVSAGGSSATSSRVPPPPPPPPQLGIPPGGPAADAQRRHRQGRRGHDEDGGRRGRDDDAMAPVPEAANDADATNDDADAVIADDDVAMAGAPSRRPPARARYLRVRVPPPSSRASPWPTRVRRRHRGRRPPSNDDDNGGSSSTSVAVASSSSYASIRNGGGGRSRTAGPTPRNDVDDEMEEGEVVLVLIPPDGSFVSERRLADCLGHIDRSTFSCLRDDHYASSRGGRYDTMDDDDEYSVNEYYEERNAQNIAGMYRESDRAFIPLSVIYSDPTSFVGEVLCLKCPPPPLPKRNSHFRPTIGHAEAVRRRSVFVNFLEWMGILVVLYTSWYVYQASQHIEWEYIFNKVEGCIFAAMNLPFILFDILIELPLREVYRHGPSIVGWEGEPLPRICSRITYHGDESFWTRNIDECERIYRSRELAAMQIRKPIVIGFLVLVSFYMIRSIMEARALRMRERVDPNMVETYRAIQMLTRQLRRALNAK